MSHHKHEHGNPQSHPTDEEVLRRFAYRLWEQAGRPQGQSERFWREAKERIPEKPRAATARRH